MSRIFILWFLWSIPAKYQIVWTILATCAHIIKANFSSTSVKKGIAPLFSAPFFFLGCNFQAENPVFSSIVGEDFSNGQLTSSWTGISIEISVKGFEPLDPESISHARKYIEHLNPQRYMTKTNYTPPDMKTKYSKTWWNKKCLNL